MSYSKEMQDLDFAYKVRHALNESADNLAPATLNKLADVRKLALSRKKKDAPAPVVAFSGILAGNGSHLFQGPQTLLGKIGLALPLLVLVISLMSIYEYEQKRHISDLAELDMEVLVDELPPDAYVDTGFSTYLSKAEE